MDNGIACRWMAKIVKFDNEWKLMLLSSQVDDLRIFLSYWFLETLLSFAETVMTHSYTFCKGILLFFDVNNEKVIR